ncbi:MAG: PAS domain S-box protein [Rhodoferax sp.]|nr:PAS domain S-box protein [Rhodoferax sp.]
MELFALDEDVTRLASELAALSGPARLPTLVKLAWYLRQRAGERSLELADEADALLALASTSSDLDQGRPHARLALLRSELALLRGQTEQAQTLLRAAMAAFAALGDVIGQGDAHWLQASIGVDAGDGEQVEHGLHAALVQYRQGADNQRMQAVLARQFVNASFRDPAATALQLREVFAADAARPPGVATWVQAAWANVAGLTNDPGAAIKHDLQAYHEALASGQTRQALVSVINAAESFATLGDLDAAMQWSGVALDLARGTGWPASIGFCLVQMGDVLRLLARYGESRAHLREAMTLMATQTGSRNYEQACSNMAQLALDEGDSLGALTSFQQLEVHVAVRREPDLLIKIWCGQANALRQLDRLAQARERAQAALTLAREQGHAEGQMQALCILAQTHQRQILPSPEAMGASSASLHYLHQARVVAATMEGYQLSPDFLDQLASAHADGGDFRAAFEHAKLAAQARNQTRSLAAQKRALALQIRQEVEQARAETQHHQQLSATLRETAATLETLGTIGREITSSRETKAVFEALYRHVHELLDATAFAVYLLDVSQTQLEPVFFIEAGVPLTVSPIALNSAISKCARCARERTEIVINLPAGADEPNRIAGTLATLSLLYAPLMVGERLLGVMTIQSPRQHAYAERERSIFVTLCAYGAIALDNALAYGAAEAAQRRADLALQDLRQTQARLVLDFAERQRIAQDLHELNTELETRIAQRTQEMRETVAKLALSQRKLQAIVDTALDAVVRVDASGVIVGWNAQAQILFGWSAQEALGLTLQTTIIPQQFRRAHVAGMARYLASGHSTLIDRRIEISALHRNGHEFPIELAITRVQLDEVDRYEFCAFIRDITQRKRAEEDIRASLEKQRELNQLKSRFVSMASHEFRTPLATILSSTELLRLYADRLPEAEREELFETVSVAVRRMTRMLEDVLVIGKDDAERAKFQPEPGSIDKICRQIVDALQRELTSAGAPAADVRLAVRGLACEALFDDALMRHIFGNLLSNAVKYSPQGSVVRLDVDCAEQEFTLTVTDSGIGIPQDDLPRLFESFHRAANVGNISGTGLGLAIVKRSVNLHGGRISVASQPGQGSVFTVVLPRLGAATAELTPPA